MPDHKPYRDNLEHLEDELRRLDLLIQLRLATARLRNEAVPHAQTTRSVYITREEIDWLLESEPVVERPANGVAALRQLSAEITARVQQIEAGGVWLALPLLGRLFRLSDLELGAVVVCLAPELRRKYDRLYAYLQDDITRRRPSVDLVLELLCRTERERWAASRCFSAAAPLLRAGILRTVEDPQSPSGSSGLARFLVLDPRICQFLLGNDDLDARIVGQVQARYPASEAAADPATVEQLARLAEHHLAQESQVVFSLHGPPGVGKRHLVAETSRRLGVPVLSVDIAALGAQAETVLRLAFREGLLQQAAVHLVGSDALLGDEVKPLLAKAIADFGWLVFLTGESSWTGHDEFPGAVFHSVEVSLPDLVRSTEIWRHSLAGYPDGWAVELASRYRLPGGRISAAVELADNRRLMQPEPPDLTLADLFAACRQQSGHTLGDLAVKVRLRCGWDDLVLPADQLTQLREISDQVRNHHRVFDGWGFGTKLSHGKGLSVLFAGPPGTGKTMAAAVLARDLDQDLYKVDLSGVVSKYIGETEKNLARVFGEARTSNAVLFFDEADSLFGKRTEVSDAHDRYANIETSYLLQQIEEYEGVVILATNLRQNLDDAFIRRIRFIVEFPFPDAESRTRIWQSHFPAMAPVSADVDFPRLGEQFPLPGGNIKNVVLNAAFLAAADGGVINRDHILRGAQQEFRKIGKSWHAKAD